MKSIGRNLTMSVNYVNPVEILLKNVVPIERGLSMRNLKNQTKLSRRTIKYHIYNSKMIENTAPYIHGSLKQKISVYNYNPVKMDYTKRNEKKLVNLPNET